MAKKILITGASGFLASAVINKLVHYDFDILALSRKPIKLIHPKVKWVRCDLADIRAVRQAASLFRMVRYCFHAAARMPKRQGIDGWQLIGDNLNLTINLLKVLPAGLKQFINCSSVDIYGVNSESAIDESCLPEPKTFYGLTKLFGEHLLRIHFQKKPVVITSLRFSHLYGPVEPPVKIIPRLIDCVLRGRKIQIKNQGRDSRDYLYVGDAADAVIASLGKPLKGSYNVSGGKRIRIREVIRNLECISGKKNLVKYLPAEAPSRSLFNNSKFYSASGWSPKTEFYDGLKRQYDAVRNLYYTDL